jgi:peptide/nickel transport system substrate-binding protein
MKVRKTITAIAALAATIALVTGCTSASGGSSGEGAKLTQAMISQSSGQGFDFSPGHSDWGSLLVRPVYEFLLTNQLDEKGNVSYGPGVVTAWKFDEAFTTLTLTIRKGTKFSDGTTLDAAAIAANAQYWIDQKIDINWGYFAKSVTTEGSDTVKVDLKDTAKSQGAPQIEYYMSNTPVVSAAVLKKNPKSLVSDPVGSGPYTLDTKASTPGVQYTFVKRKDYWNASAYAYDTYVMKLFPDGVGAVNALKSGQVDFAPVDTSTVADVKGAGFAILKTPGLVSGLMLGDKTGSIVPAMKDVRVRQAISMAFDRVTIAKTLDGGYALPVNQPWLPGYPQYQKSLADKYAFDVAGAKKLLAEAGYPNGFDLTIPTYTDQPSLTRYDPIIKQSLEDIGIKVTLQTTDWFPAVTGGKFAVTNNYIGPWVVQQYYLAYKGLFNPWDYKDEKMSKMLDTYNFGSATDREKVAPQIGEYAINQAWMVIWDAPQTLFAMKSNIEVTKNLPYGNAPDLNGIKPKG